MQRKWHWAMLMFAAATAGCNASSDEIMLDSDESEVGEAEQRETLTCPLSVASNAAQVIPSKSLIINDLAVVEDECRTKWNSTNTACTASTKNKWHFWYLMQQMAGANNPTKFILRLFESVENWQPLVNGMKLQQRTLIRDKVIKPWMQKTNETMGNICDPTKSIMDAANANCALNPAFTPLRLLAIVNRMDLRANGVVNGFYGGGSAGEGRFVFGFTDLNSLVENQVTHVMEPKSLSGTIILEYALPTPSGWNPVQWASKWRALSNFAAFDNSYKASLQTVTDKFTLSGAVSGGVNNGSAISQIRMNDFAFDQGRTIQGTFLKVWSLREFKLACPPEAPSCASNAAYMLPAPVKQTPANTSGDAEPVNFNGSSALQDYLTTNASAIIAGSHSVPAQLSVNFIAKPFMAAESTSRSFGNGMAQMQWMPANWDPSTQNNTRRLFAFSTCNGCHYAETETNNMHVASRNPGVKAALSPFLTGQFTVTSDPSFEEFTYDEPGRRACELAWLLAGNPDTLSTNTGRIH